MSDQKHSAIERIKEAIDRLAEEEKRLDDEDEKIRQQYVLIDAMRFDLNEILDKVKEI